VETPRGPPGAVYGNLLKRPSSRLLMLGSGRPIRVEDAIYPLGNVSEPREMAQAVYRRSKKTSLFRFI